MLDDGLNQEHNLTIGKQEEEDIDKDMSAELVKAETDLWKAKYGVDSDVFQIDDDPVPKISKPQSSSLLTPVQKESEKLQLIRDLVANPFRRLTRATAARIKGASNLPPVTEEDNSDA